MIFTVHIYGIVVLFLAPPVQFIMSHCNTQLKWCRIKFVENRKLISRLSSICLSASWSLAMFILLFVYGALNVMLIFFTRACCIVIACLSFNYDDFPIWFLLETAICVFCVICSNIYFPRPRTRSMVKRTIRSGH